MKPTNFRKEKICLKPYAIHLAYDCPLAHFESFENTMGILYYFNCEQGPQGWTLAQMGLKPPFIYDHLLYSISMISFSIQCEQNLMYIVIIVHTGLLCGVPNL